MLCTLSGALYGPLESHKLGAATDPQYHIVCWLPGIAAVLCWLHGVPDCPAYCGGMDRLASPVDQSYFCRLGGFSHGTYLKILA
jgi:hypothetical protein